MHLTARYLAYLTFVFLQDERECLASKEQDKTTKKSDPGPHQAVTVCCLTI